jgi:hypothetical protein
MYCLLRITANKSGSIDQIISLPTPQQKVNTSIDSNERFSHMSDLKKYMLY